MSSRPSETCSLLYRRTPAVLAVLSVAILFSCDGCSAHPSPAPSASLARDAGEMSDDDLEVITEDDDYEILPISYRFYLTDGNRDIANRYPFTVMISASVRAHRTIFCSGTLLSPHLVLTAGHCVCEEHAVTQPGSPSQFLIDGSNCAKEASVDTVTYAPASDPSPFWMNEQSRSYSGKVQPHPNLEILLDRSGVPLSSRADLAVIALDQPVGGVPSMVRLPTTEVQLNESFTIAGYGFDGRTDQILGRRRFGRKKITRLSIPSNEGILFEQAGEAFTSGSGEPCLRQGKREVELIGVTTLISAEGAAFTSTYPYRDWLLSELRRTSSQSSHPSGNQGSVP